MMTFQAGLLTRVRPAVAPSRPKSVACCQGGPPHSVGHVADSHRVPDSSRVGHLDGIEFGTMNCIALSRDWVQAGGSCSAQHLTFENCVDGLQYVVDVVSDAIDLPQHNIELLQHCTLCPI